MQKESQFRKEKRMVTMCLDALPHTHKGQDESRHS